MNRDLALGGATLAIAAAYYAMASTIQRSLLSDEVGPDRLPKTYAILLAALSLVLIIRRVYRARPALRQEANRTRPPVRQEQDTEPNLPRVAGMVLIGVAYIAVLPWIGYLLAIALLIATTAAYQGGAGHRQIALIAVFGALVFWLLFVWLLGVPQPPGPWPSLLDAARSGS